MKSGSGHQSNSLPDELYIKNMDEEQIWQQLELHNESFYNKCMKEIRRLVSLDDDKFELKVKYPGDSEEVDENSAENEESDNENEESDNENESPGSDSDESDAKNDVETSEDEQESDQHDDDTTKESDKKNKKTSVKNAESVLDDQFFKFSEMEAFLDSEDKKELDRLNSKRPKQNDIDSDDESEIDYFDNLSDDNEIDSEGELKATKKTSKKENRMMYGEFFDSDNEQEESMEEKKQRRRMEREEKNKRKQLQMNEDLGMGDSQSELDDDGNAEEAENENVEQDESEGSEMDSENEVKEKSEFDLRQDRLKKRIEDLEENALADKQWQLKGEITSSTRPKNSLLEEILDFDSVARPPPLITEETTFCLEDIIKRRIKSKAWDDVERKIKPINDQQDFRKNLVLQQEKSKESLAQIYEKDYLEKVHKLNNVDADSDKPDEPQQYKEIRKAMKDLFVKLDALSNFHFTAKPVAAEPKVITNLPAIEMEEVAPVSVSDATLLAPEEIRQHSVGDEIGKTERSSADKKRERRKKKHKQKLIKLLSDKRVEEKEKLGIKVTTKEKQKQLLNQVSKSRNVIKVSVVIDNESSFSQLTHTRTNAV